MSGYFPVTPVFFYSELRVTRWLLWHSDFTKFNYRCNVNFLFFCDWTDPILSLATSSRTVLVPYPEILRAGASTPYKRWSKCTMKKIGGGRFLQELSLLSGGSA